VEELQLTTRQTVSPNLSAIIEEWLAEQDGELFRVRVHNYDGCADQEPRPDGAIAWRVGGWACHRADVVRVALAVRRRLAGVDIPYGFVAMGL